MRLMDDAMGKTLRSGDSPMVLVHRTHTAVHNVVGGSAVEQHSMLRPVYSNRQGQQQVVAVDVDRGVQPWSLLLLHTLAVAWLHSTSVVEPLCMPSVLDIDHGSHRIEPVAPLVDGASGDADDDVADGHGGSAANGGTVADQDRVAVVHTYNSIARSPYRHIHRTPTECSLRWYSRRCCCHLLLPLSTVLAVNVLPLPAAHIHQSPAVVAPPSWLEA